MLREIGRLLVPAAHLRIWGLGFRVQGLGDRVIKEGDRWVLKLAGFVLLLCFFLWLQEFWVLAFRGFSLKVASWASLAASEIGCRGFVQ